uniref:Signal peptidase complex subunit 2 n=1 Tax=Scolopendra viridis TaxID=118503 RepID=A0A4D5RAC0_SCOVI
MSQKKSKDSFLKQWSIDDKPVKVDKWDGTAVKNALDDAVRKIFVEKYKYQESHVLMDGRLAICGLAVLVAMFALVWDYLYPFPQSRPVLIFCVVSYFVMMGVLTLYTTVKEKGIFFTALQKDAAGLDPDGIWRASSYLKRFDDIYHLVITYSDGTTGQNREVKLSKSIASWFDDNGTLLLELFEPDVAKLHSSLTSERKDK